MSGNAQERLEKLKTKLRASVAAKQENAASTKTSGVSTRNKGSAVHAMDKLKKVPSSLTQINAQPPDRKILDLVSQKRHAIQMIKPHHQVPENKTHESFSGMRMKKASAKSEATNVSRSVGIHAHNTSDKSSSEYRQRHLKRKSSQRGSKSDRKSSQEYRLDVSSGKTKNVGFPEQALRNSKFNIPKKPTTTAAEAKSVRSPPLLSNSSESLKNAADCISTTSNFPPNKNPCNLDESAANLDLAGILKNMRPTRGRLELAKTSSDQNIRSSKRKNQLTHRQDKQLDQGSLVVAKENPVERNMFKRKAPGSVSDMTFEAARAQLKTNVDHMSGHSSHGVSKESNHKQQAKQRYDKSVKPSHEGALVDPHKNFTGKDMIRKRKVSSSSDLLPESQIQSRGDNQISGDDTHGLTRESNQEKQPMKQCDDATVKPSSLNKSASADNNANVQRNLFKRKVPGPVRDLNPRAAQIRSSDLISNQTSHGLSKESNNTLQKTNLRNSHKSNHESGFKEIVSKAFKGVVSTVKETAYYCSRSEVSKELQTVRRTVESVEAMDYEITSVTFEDEQTPLVQTDLYIVVDTNVAIDNLSLIKSFKTRKVKGMTPKVIVPWQVLKELDFLKEGKNRIDAIVSRARKGIHYLVEEMCKYGGFISGQPQKAALRELEDFKVEVPDDHLIKCCLQLKNNGHNVMLLTNDKNLVIKGVVSGVPSMKCVDFIENCPENPPPQTFSPFETPPAGTFPQDLLPIANAAHQMTVLLKNFLNAVLKKFLKYRFQELWKLRIPGEEPWSLTVLLESILDYWHEISTKYGASINVKDTLLFLRRYIHKVAYDKLRYVEVDQFARACHQLAVALPPSFGAEGVSFDNRLAFWKCPSGTEPPSDVTFSRSCVNLTIHHMQLFENNLVQYCFSISKTLGVPFSHPKVSSCYPSVVDLSNLPKIICTIKVMGEALTEISTISPGSVGKNSDGVKALYSSLLTSLGGAADMRFFIEDVVEFCNCSEIRHLFPDALHSLEVMAFFLKSTLGDHRNCQESSRPIMMF